MTDTAPRSSTNFTDMTSLPPGVDAEYTWGASGPGSPPADPPIQLSCSKRGTRPRWLSTRHGCAGEWASVGSDAAGSRCRYPRTAMRHSVARDRPDVTVWRSVRLMATGSTGLTGAMCRPTAKLPATVASAGRKRRLSISVNTPAPAGGPSPQRSNATRAAANRTAALVESGACASRQLRMSASVDPGLRRATTAGAASAGRLGAFPAAAAGIRPVRAGAALFGGLDRASRTVASRRRGSRP